MRRVPKTPADLGLLVLASQLRRNAQRGVVPGLLSVPMVAIEQPRRGDWIFALALLAFALLQAVLVLRKVASIDRALRRVRTRDATADEAEQAGLPPILGRASLIGFAAALALAGWGLLALRPLPKEMVLTGPSIGLLLVTIGLLGSGGLGLAVAGNVQGRILTGPPEPDQANRGRLATEPAPMPATPNPSTDANSRYRGFAIACSGGGIRSAAFCLGALQHLRQRGAYDRADRVYAISGGGYTATGLHLARRESPRDEAGNPPADLFAPDSPEMDWLRRHSSFLTPTASIRMRGVLAVLYGIGTSIAVLVAVMWAASAYSVWVLDRLPDQGAPQLSEPRATFVVSPRLRWSILLILAAAGAWHLGVNAVMKYRRKRLATLQPTVALLALAATATLMLVLIPKTVVLTHNATVSNQPTAAIAKSLRWAQLVPDEICEQAVGEDFVRQAQIAWHRVANPDAAEAIPFSYGACGDVFEDDALLFRSIASAPLTAVSAQNPYTPSDNTPPVSAPPCIDPATGRAASPLPHYCDLVQRDTTGGWATRITALVALASTLAATWRKRSGTEATSKPGRLAAFVRRRVLPWSVVAALIGLLGLAGMHMGRSLATTNGRLDQWWVWPVPLATYLLVRLLSDASIASLHPFYRERLADTFLIRRTESGGVEPIPLWHTPVEPMPRADGVSAEPPGPALSILCAANVSDQDYIPTQRACTTFRFETGRAVSTRAYVGITDSRLPQQADTGGRLTAGDRPIPISPTAYALDADPSGRDTTLAAAMAASGAAFSPIIGRKQAMVAPYRILLTLANARLGIWLPNPYDALVSTDDPEREAPLPALSWWRAAYRRLVDKPGPFRILKEAVGLQSITDSRIYVSDGGHFDNTGIVEALRDRPAVLLVLEASADPAGTLDAITDALTTARMDLGLVITPASAQGWADLQTPPVSEDDLDPRPAVPYVHLQARQGVGSEVVTQIFVVKNVLSELRDVELDAYRLDHPDFPVSTTLNQFYGEYDLEAYRQLGWHNAGALLSSTTLPLPDVLR